ncbi:unnamed protein product [Ceratitis capitata]|uniref:(Mediterranean fruit fly) hypothetical protein n=1 Tax=Ceratitis capitata TaxID=7213 RepID=A0A811U365_CERCA|nr:unnamed protein product [Ceratitis capitata]
MSSGACKATARLLKCFCGCSEMTEEEVRRIYRLSAQDTLNDSNAAQLFRRFLEKERCDDEEGEIENKLNIYELCHKYLQQDSLTYDQLNDLIDLGLKYPLEKIINFYITILEENERPNILGHEIERDLKCIQHDYRSEIEACSEYRKYKQAILDKLKHSK